MPENTTAAKLGTLWCSFMHDSPMWPIHGQYQCRTCGRHYAVPWAGDSFLPARVRQARVPSFRSALLPLVILMAILLASSAQAADASRVDSTAPAAMAFARYTAGLAQAGPWGLESVEIEASLPKFEKHGRLRAIRRLLPLGKPEYEVLELAGDQMVP